MFYLIPGCLLAYGLNWPGDKTVSFWNQPEVLLLSFNGVALVLNPICKFNCVLSSASGSQKNSFHKFRRDVISDSSQGFLLILIKFYIDRDHCPKYYP